MTRYLSHTVLVFLLSLLSMNDATALETPDYTVQLADGDFEVRDYAPYIVAEVTVTGTQRSSGNDAFKVLAGYIFGDNRQQEKMSMTAPVESQQAEGVRMNMTAPVESTPQGEDEFIYSFVMESKYTMDTLPEPLNPRIRLRQKPQRIMAVHEFSGSWSESNYEKHEQALGEWLDAQGFIAVGQPVFARYNSPFRPWFLRHNEVMVEIDPASINR